MNKSIAPILLSIFGIFWVALAINPLYRDIWVAEKLNPLLFALAMWYRLINQHLLAIPRTGLFLYFVFCKL